jgi:hypothetical protein
LNPRPPIHKIFSLSLNQRLFFDIFFVIKSKIVFPFYRSNKHQQSFKHHADVKRKWYRAPNIFRIDVIYLTSNLAELASSVRIYKKSVMHDVWNFSDTLLLPWKRYYGHEFIQWYTDYVNCGGKELKLHVSVG